MHKTTVALLSLALAGAVSASAAFAYREYKPSPYGELPPEEAFAMDLPMTAEAAAAMRTESTIPTFPNPWGVTHETVGEADTFGRSVTYLGLMASHIALAPQCPRANAYPGELCQAVTDTGAWTRFAFNNIGSIRLPAASTHSMLCQWLTPVLDVTYRNNSQVPAMGQFWYTPTLTIRNPVLDDPALINPLTDAPFAGALTTGLSFNERQGESLFPGITYNMRDRKSTVCVAGTVSRSRLMQVYGLTEAQADRFLASPMTIEMNIIGWTRHVESAWLSLNMRLMGDSRM